MKVAIIPTRGGSSGLPGKNIRPLMGRALISYTIEAALDTSELTSVFVSTDDDDIERVARQEGAKVIRHPPELSGPTSPTAPVIAWDLEYLESLGLTPETVVVLRATTPLRTADDIRGGLALLYANPAADSVVSVAAANTHPARLKKIDSDFRLHNAFPGEKLRPLRRQEFETLYVRNGGMYISKRDVITPDAMWGNYCLGYQMPPERSININTDYDFLVAQLMMQHNRNCSLIDEPL